ncbi:MAG TPA: NAD(P)-dependent oxidoreductase, partial [Microthrixaceae bacterium]|nr:NAD(P)-dependent oxidoreductase [Microthrixaceae bacterium]
MLQVQLRVESRRCLVVGGGTVGTRRAKALLDAGAIVVVVDPTPSATLETLAAGSDAAESVPASGNLSGRLELLRRNFADSDMTEPDGLILVVAATNDPATNAAVGAAARRAGVLVNRADDVGSGDLAFPALARRGPVSIGVSTHGATSGSGEVNAGPVPVLARWVAQRLDEGVDELLGLDAAALTLLAELLAEARAEVRAEVHGE